MMSEQTTDTTMSPTIGALAAALAKAQAELSGVAKGADNPFFKSKYADLHSCLEAAREPLAKNNLAVIQTTSGGESGINVITTLVHSSGEWIRGSLYMKPKKDDDQGRGSSLTYGRRYGFAAIIGLAQKDDDGNASSGNKKEIKESKSQKLLDSMEARLDKKFKEGLTEDGLAEIWEKHIIPRKNEFVVNDWTAIENIKKETLNQIIERSQ